MEELKSLLRSPGGNALFEYLRKIESRQAEIVQNDARTKDLGDIRFAAGRKEGVSIVIATLLDLKRGTDA